MIPLYTQEEFDGASSRFCLSFECEFCHNIFTREKHDIQKYYSRIKNNKNPNFQLKYCSRSCAHKSNRSGKNLNCKQCDKKIYKTRQEIKKSKSGNYFCSHSCTGLYTNSHKKTGNNRSKLELWLETQLNTLYPKLNIEYNNVKLFGVELDIYIPSLKLAFELNGIFHYEPIFGNSRLNEIQHNDQRKFKFCNENKIGLCIIDTSFQKKFTIDSSKKFLSIITKIINEKLGCPTEFESA